MVHTTVNVFLFIYILVSILVVVPLVVSKEFCKLKNGNIGMCLKGCLNSKFEQSVTNCSKPLEVCCLAMERIVTPFNPVAQAPPLASPPLSPQPIQPTLTPTLPQIVEVSTKATAAANTLPPFKNIAIAKCEEYKHRVSKREDTIIMPYVFGGTQSPNREFPHMAALGYGQPDQIEYLCGGSLISEQFVLTAAHCLIVTNLGPLTRIRLGDLDLFSAADDAKPEDFGVNAHYVYPSYQTPSQYNDIGLVKMDRPVQFNSYIAPICLQTGPLLANLELVATGWGRTELGGQQSSVLMRVDLQYFSNEECQKNYENVPSESIPYGILDVVQICAGSRYDERDTCQGDSGGPLQIKDDVYYLVGVTSFGKQCGVANSPAVYTRVSAYVPWIEQIVWSQYN